MRTVISSLESGRAVDAGEDGATAAALVLVELGLLDDVIARFAVDCFIPSGLVSKRVLEFRVSSPLEVVVPEGWEAYRRPFLLC